MGLMELGLLPLLLDGDSVELLASRFGVSMDSIESVNGIVPGEPYPIENSSTPALVPSPYSDAIVVVSMQGSCLLRSRFCKTTLNYSLQPTISVC
ncbi:hypothetical protein HanXRQr2_Chr16g0747911 [Helianthus annuus]|uniref:LysM domain-containing protein n=1 Tax=Helianthus annuus TaxID=4232 RepID=A0A9K3DQX4_HELAN|nr:hypothetical protein HanXRQr2_Chr16g0747911 [Helianthus annuus]KAJ0438099.1 hypothetical protein HanHA300_Chr16g0610051 [Helianthus annuus]KAJ0442742.1 hypothetical protein HanIR_Chr16g0812831 [Helianthus annuus]KAJ0460423.1 hypothetical protein HanHA89_Chr16g0660641 [Helianthus annuus]KAJ0640865.1 hypothetical protein HanLR1_Chr16g0620571 [Helianthus annuus]